MRGCRVWAEDAVGAGQGSTVGLCMYWRVPLWGQGGTNSPGVIHALPSLLPQHCRVQWAKLGENPRMCLTTPVCYA